MLSRKGPGWSGIRTVARSVGRSAASDAMPVLLSLLQASVVRIFGPSHEMRETIREMRFLLDPNTRWGAKKLDEFEHKLDEWKFHLPLARFPDGRKTLDSTKCRGKEL